MEKYKTEPLTVRAVIINGRHAGEAFFMDYSPRVKIPIRDMSQISIGEADDSSVKVGDLVEYAECFRSADGFMVLYSTHGKSSDMNSFIHYLKPTYPFSF